jgi:Zn-dependent protease with chaperone function
LKGFDALIKTLSGLVNERKARLAFLASTVRVDERQFPAVHALLLQVCEVLDTADVPELYVAADPTLNASTFGMDRPIIVLNSALLDLLATEELRFVIGHEVGHVLSGHAVYRTLMLRLMRLTRTFGLLPFGGLANRAILAALFEWWRKAELSADRAGLLATQDPAVALRTQMQMASGGHVAELDVTSFFEQGQEYLATEDLRDSVLKFLLIEQSTHPYAVVRAAELRRWVDSGGYTAVLQGAYPRRVDDDQADISEAARDAAASYGEAFETTGDALGRLLHDVAGVAGSAKTWIDERMRRP